MRKVRKILLGLVLVVGAAIALVSIPRVALLASGATPVQLETAPFQPLSLGCAGVGIPDVVIGSYANGDIVFVRRFEPGPAPLVWPWGYSAWLVDGRVEIVRPEGTVLAVEGDVLSDFGGCIRDDSSVLVDAGILGSAITVKPPKNLQAP